MGIWDRLGSVINSYINDFGEQTSSRLKGYGNSRSSDPDFDAAYDELNDFLNGNEKSSGTKGSQTSGQYSWREAGTSGRNRTLPPDELRADFDILEVPFGADAETCKTSYKNLLKIHHPDRHAGMRAIIKKLRKGLQR